MTASRMRGLMTGVSMAVVVALPLAACKDEAVQSQAPQSQADGQGGFGGFTTGDSETEARQAREQAQATINEQMGYVQAVMDVADDLTDATKVGTEFAIGADGSKLQVVEAFTGLDKKTGEDYSCFKLVDTKRYPDDAVPVPGAWFGDQDGTPEIILAKSSGGSSYRPSAPSSRPSSGFGSSSSKPSVSSTSRPSTGFGGSLAPTTPRASVPSVSPSDRSNPLKGTEKAAPWTGGPWGTVKPEAKKAEPPKPLIIPPRVPADRNDWARPAPERSRPVVVPPVTDTRRPADQASRRYQYGGAASSRPTITFGYKPSSNDARPRERVIVVPQVSHDYRRDDGPGLADVMLQAYRDAMYYRALREAEASRHAADVERQRRLAAEEDARREYNLRMMREDDGRGTRPSVADAPVVVPPVIVPPVAETAAPPEVKLDETAVMRSFAEAMSGKITVCRKTENGAKDTPYVLKPSSVVVTLSAL